MKKIRHLLEGLRTSFWFLPFLIVAFSIALAITLIDLHSSERTQWMERWPRIFGAGAEGARGMLSTIAGSMMTAAGVTFSMTLVALTLASGQYTSRILRNFMRDRVTQVVLGVFAGIFVYCLLVLRTIRDGIDGGFVPSLAVSFSVVLATGGIAVLIFFIHHVADSIQAATIIGSVADETLEAVDRLFPEAIGQSVPDVGAHSPLLAPTRRVWQTVPAKKSGYIKSVDSDALVRLAREHQTVVRMERAIGEFVAQDTALVAVAMDELPNEKLTAPLRAAYRIGRHRTLQDDCAFGIRQIVDIALRALSPSMNDTTTAVMCVEYMTAIMVRLAGRDIPDSYRYEGKELRVIANGDSFASLLNLCFDQVRTSATGNLAILLRMLDSLDTIAGETSNPERRSALRRQVRAIAELAEQTIHSTHDRERFEHRLAHVHQAFISE